MDYQAAYKKLQEEKDALLKDKDYLIQQQADEIERLRRDVKKQQEKMFELAKARELKEMEAVKTWCNQRNIVLVGGDVYQSMIAFYGRKMKRGTWVDVEFSISGDSTATCSLCGAVVHSSFTTKPNFCPQCGAMMEVLP